MTNIERQFLWSQYPEVQEMFEEYNGILLEDDTAWEAVVIRCRVIRDMYHGTAGIEAALIDAAYQLEMLAKKRRGMTQYEQRRTS